MTDALDRAVEEAQLAYQEAVIDFWDHNLADTGDVRERSAVTATGSVRPADHLFLPWKDVASR